MFLCLHRKIYELPDARYSIDQTKEEAALSFWRVKMILFFFAFKESEDEAHETEYDFDAANN